MNFITSEKGWAGRSANHAIMNDTITYLSCYNMTALNHLLITVQYGPDLCTVNNNDKIFNIVSNMIWEKVDHDNESGFCWGP